MKRKGVKYFLCILGRYNSFYLLSQNSMVRGDNLYSTNLMPVSYYLGIAAGGRRRACCRAAWLAKCSAPLRPSEQFSLGQANGTRLFLRCWLPICLARLSIRHSFLLCVSPTSSSAQRQKGQNSEGVVYWELVPAEACMMPPLLSLYIVIDAFAVRRPVGSRLPIP